MQRLLPALAALLLIAIPGATLAPGGTPNVGPDEVPDEVIVGFDGAIPAWAEGWVQAQGGQVLLRNDAIHFLTVRLADAAAAERFLAAAHAREGVAHAERDGYVYADFTPNDPLLSQQYAVADLNLQAAWDHGLGNHGIKVAVLDTGVTLTHPDLQANLCGPYNWWDGSGTVVDGNGHGTHTSGTVAAGLNNGIGIAGTSNACLMHGKVLGASGGGQWSWVADGVTWAADNGADIISMSLGGSGGAAVLQQAVEYAYNTKGVLIVASSGNSGCGLPNGKLGYPAEYDQVMGVGALSSGSVPASYTTCGLDLEISAPGTGVLSTAGSCAQTPRLCSSTGYATATGTSMAAPHVAGSAALVKAAIPGLAAKDLRCLLDLTADDVVGTVPGRDHTTGWGKVDPNGAIDTYNDLTAQGLWDEFQAACAAGAALIMY